ncbi:flavohemoglobin expression-modulating QEGLA motif protein [soil metagenome]
MNKEVNVNENERDLTDEFISEVTQKIKDEKEIRWKLTGGGLLHFDRPLPFLLVFRQTPGKKDRAMSLLVRSQASYLIAPADVDSEMLQKLVKAIAKTVSGNCGAFLIVELWASATSGEDGNGKKRGGSKSGSAADFIIRAPKEVKFSSIGYLKENLDTFRAGYRYTTTKILSGRRHPPGCSSLMDAKDLKEHETLLIGLEIGPFYLNPETGKPYPLLLRKLAHGLSDALQRTFFEFVRIQTNLEVAHFQMLGRRVITDPALEVDDRLARIDDSIRFLLLITPINIRDAWQTFKKSGFEKKPEFHYRMMPVDPEVQKRALYNIAIERVEDPTLAFLFREKRNELGKLLTLLAERGKPEFMPGCMQYYGPPGDTLIKLSEDLLSHIPPNTHNKSNRYISPEEFAGMARSEIDYYRRDYKEITAEVSVQDDIAGLLVSKGNLFIGTDAHIEDRRAKALIQHEIGTHVLTYFNGRAQPLKLLYCGMPRYEELQEGLAVLSEYLVGGLTPSRLRLLAARVVAVQSIIQGADFVETFRILHHDHGYDAHLAFTITMRVYRGGGLTKDAIYLSGLTRVLKWLEEGNELEPLFIGKIREDYLPLIRELLYRRILNPAPLRPRYLDDPEVLTRIKELKSGTSVINLVQV